jgi:hypothetical protein
MSEVTDRRQTALNRFDAPPAGGIDRVMRWVRFDPRPAHRQPSSARLVVATVAAIVLSLLADWLIARFAIALWRSTAHYPHFHVADYARLTVAGIIGAAIGWPIVTRWCAAPRWLYLRLAVLVTAVLLLPDVYLYLRGSRGNAVAALVCMHLAIAVISYNAIVRIAPVRALTTRYVSVTHSGWQPPSTCDQCPHSVDEHEVWAPGHDERGWMLCRVPGCDRCWHDWRSLAQPSTAQYVWGRDPG